MTFLAPLLAPAVPFLADDLHPALLTDTEIYFIVFGVVMILGGIMGFVKAKSQASLIAGGLSGLLLIVGALMMPTAGGWKTGLVIELLVCLALLGRFLPALLRGKYNPAGYIVPLAVIGAVVAIVFLCGIVVVHV